MVGLRSLLYTLAKLMGDVNAVKKGKVGKRVQRRVAGKATGRAMRKLLSKPPSRSTTGTGAHNAFFDRRFTP